MREYEREFSRICALVPQAVRGDRHKVRLFSQGLRPEICRLLSSLRIWDFDDCMERSLSIQADIEVVRAERHATEKGEEKK